MSGGARKALLRGAAVLALLGVIAGLAALPALSQATLTAAAASVPADAARIEHGRYLVDAGDCVACHTRPGGEIMAGGLPMNTPFGVIYSANITPDPNAGIGGWSADQFYRAMHEGVRANGARLYPAFPYPYYTHVTRADADDIRAYLMTLTPVAYTPPANKLPPPLGWRFVLRFWNLLFFRPAPFQAEGTKSAEWNRGAYLVQGLGHCGACHTPKNMFGADKAKEALQGGTLDNWHAPNLNGDARDGLGGWSQADIVEYLKTGRNARSTASGSMQDVVTLSTSRLSDADLNAIAVYLKSLPPRRSEPSMRPADVATMKVGEAVFVDNCAACHRMAGQGVPGFFPPLAGDASVQARDPTTSLRLILEGTRSPVTAARPTPLGMPAFNWKLDDDQIAAVATYIRNSWGNAAPEVSSRDVGKLRRDLGSEAELKTPPRS